MLSDQPQAVSPLAPEPGKGPVRTKVRIRFRKGGDLRLVSHHDLMTCFERMLRRAAIPFRSTQGFHPQPRLVFGLSLALGIVGSDEAADLELDGELSPEEIHARLARQAPPGLEFFSVRRVDPRARIQARSVTYRFPLPPEREPELPARVAALLAAPACWVERTRPNPRRLNLRPYLRDLRLPPGALEMDLWVTPTGTARADELLQLLGLGDLLEAGAILERTRVELCDENPAPGDSLPAPEGTGPERDTEGPGEAGATPLVPGPLSFES